MPTIFTILKFVSVNHQPMASSQVIITDTAGKPNGLLSDLVHDLINDALLFVNLADLDTPDELIAKLHEHTPLPNDVLDEYGKILTEPCFGLNIAPQKDTVEIVVHR
ncbi:hypothetical protein [Levilactobacillus zymae]|uniref:Uncharacterized protein n=1 Tax=Levilactobacillus zymae TaxID=267363 RepID=A0A1Y6JYM2_9LACO|nr:hypothetical protein [Levilactobacillus zymae]KRL16379.1 hypothetical protein FD38_GL002423 [Levilactobacillus zymae DSM 19395]QFR62379.1 hypothetical protein LZ395_12860 [Levilactobacillus zymae]GEO73187.1 hypothetical protein LZY01_23550 [Levilactobacillus zymae]SMS15008.1 hypothetical protein LZ3411_1958 [Levilactobacillus zymae]